MQRCVGGGAAMRTRGDLSDDGRHARPIRMVRRPSRGDRAEARRFDPRWGSPASPTWGADEHRRVGDAELEQPMLAHDRHRAGQLQVHALVGEVDLGLVLPRTPAASQAASLRLRRSQPVPRRRQAGGNGALAESAMTEITRTCVAGSTTTCATPGMPNVSTTAATRAATSCSNCSCPFLDLRMRGAVVESVGLIHTVFGNTSLHGRPRCPPVPATRCVDRA